MEGKISTGDYIDKNGAKVYFTELIGNNVQFLGNVSESGARPQESRPRQKQENYPPRNFNNDNNDSYSQETFGASDVPF